MFYFVKTPWWLKKIYSACTWEINTAEKVIYLTFDDGPHPSITPFVLSELKRYNAKATFFCIGKNVATYPEVYAKIVADGHSIGNHTHTHLNGWHTKNNEYFNDILLAKNYIPSELFRPPYGKIRFSQLRELKMQQFDLKAIMWTVLSGDFDIDLAKEQCLKNVINHTRRGSIVVFHDSEKAFERMSYTLPEVLKHFAGSGYRFDKIKMKGF